MPRITAGTVAEHRERQRELLLGAAVELVREGGPAALTARAVTSRAGLARNSLYGYFPTIEDLLAATYERLFVAWTQAVTEAVRDARDPHAQVLAYVATTLRQAADEDHGWRVSMSREALPAAVRERVVALHEPLRRPLLDAVQALDRPAPELDAALVQALVDAGIRRIDAGDDVELVLPHVVAAADAVITAG